MVWELGRSLRFWLPVRLWLVYRHNPKAGVVKTGVNCEAVYSQIVISSCINADPEGLHRRYVWWCERIHMLRQHIRFMLQCQRLVR